MIEQVKEKYFTAIENGDTVTVKNLVESGIDINLRNANYETGIILATSRNNFEMVKLLVTLGANVNRPSKEIDNTPIMIASVEGYTEIVQFLVENTKPDMTILNGYGGTALIPACEKGHVEVVELLLTKTDVKVNHVNKLGWTALLEAVILSSGGKNHQEIVRLLLEHGADKNLGDKEGVTPLEHAKQKRFKEIVEILS
ncbi:ankyrin repeat domain-containing protein [Paenibacillus montanisoli]|uniref:Ankyrin repeat domain-containing protein n=2 Tax=Paenibacillus montanisoli TaxID=2081970 RepID=A0A328TTM0_9BACL|nr:ankyrin repeat domain-containing protein [Paenibacillus montanisoli]